MNITVEIYDDEDGKVVASMDDPDIEERGENVVEVLHLLADRLQEFSEGVFEAIESVIKDHTE